MPVKVVGAGIIGDATRILVGSTRLDRQGEELLETLKDDFSIVLGCSSPEGTVCLYQIKGDKGLYIKDGADFAGPFGEALALARGKGHVTLKLQQLANEYTK